MTAFEVFRYLLFWAIICIGPALAYRWLVKPRR